MRLPTFRNNNYLLKTKIVTSRIIIIERNEILYMFVYTKRDNCITSSLRFFRRAAEIYIISKHHIIFLQYSVIHIPIVSINTSYGIY